MPPKSRQATTTTTRIPPSTASPPIALLWAHQLRRENNALIERIHALEKSVTDAVHRIEGERRKVAEERERIGNEVEELKGGVIDLEKWMEGLREWREKVQEKENDRDGVVDGLKREVGELKEGPAGNCKRRRRRKATEPNEVLEESPLVARTQHRLESIELGDTAPKQHHPTTVPGEFPVSVQTTDILVRDSMVTQTPPDMPPEIPESQPNCHQAAETQLHLQREGSTLTQSTTDLDAIGSRLSLSQMNQLPRESSSLRLVQGTLSLSGYLQLGEDTRANFPGRRQEGRVVEAFWDGMNDCETKKVLEERLEKDGWVWEVVRNVCGSNAESQSDGVRGEGEGEKLGVPSGGYQEEHTTPTLRELIEEQNKENTVGPVEKKRKRKRRVIPVVPVDEDDYVT